MKTDKLFYRIFLSQPDLISELVPDIPANCEFDYSAPVVKETELRLDGLLTPISGDLNLPLVFLEAQMQSDDDFYGRFFAGIFLYLRQYKVSRSWRGLVILRRRNQNLGAESAYQVLLDTWVHRLYLEDLIDEVNLSPNLSLLRLLVIPEQEMSASAQKILRNSNTPAEFRRRLDLVEAILINKFPQLSIEEVRLMLNLKEADITQTRFYQEVFQIGRQDGRQEGRQEGQQIGKQIGRQEGEIEIVLRILNRRCGQLSIAQQAQIKALPITNIESLAEALLDFKGMEDLEIWLRENVA
jgi:predicted transposase/invertase (TIGR01784 family)